MVSKGPQDKSVGVERRKKVRVFGLSVREVRRMRKGAIDRSMDKVFGPEKYPRKAIRWSAWY